MRAFTATPVTGTSSAALADGHEAGTSLTQLMTNPVAIIRTRTRGDIVVELFPQTAPQSVRSFIDLAIAGYFDGLAFWRIEKGWLI